MPPAVLAIDIGTSSVRASVYGSALQSASQTQVRYRWHEFDDGRVEIDPLRLERLLLEVIDGTLHRRRAPIAAVGIAAFWHSLLGVDARGTPVTPLIPWSDTRSGEDAVRLARSLDARRVHQRTGCPLHASYWPARLRWFAKHEPSVYRRVARWMSFTEWLEARWLGRRGVSISQASGTGLLHQDSCEWDPEMLRVLGLGPRSVSPLVDLDDRAELSPTLRKRWPALKHARWVPAAGDGALNNVGAGCAGGGRAALMIGTSGALRLIFDVRAGHRVHQPAGLWRYRLDRRRVVVGGALSNGGNVREWILRTLGAARSIDAKALRLPPASHGLTMLPFLTGTRSPDYLAHATGVLAGLRYTTLPEHILRASLEAVAYRFGLVFDLLTERFPIREVVAAGGALEKSRGWTQIIADVLGRPITMSRAPELTSRGAALIALEQLGFLDASRQQPPRGSTLEPDRRRHKVYRAAMARQQELLAALRTSGLL